MRTNLAIDERAAICDEFDRVGPDHPTLCGGWDTRDLLAHLLVRERNPLAAPGIVIPALASVTDRAMAAYADRDFPTMVAQLRGGAPPWSPYHLGSVDEFVNAAEFFVHHEDIRRATPGWEPRPADPVRDAELWAMLRRVSRMLFRRQPVGLVLRRPRGTAEVVRTGSGLVTIVGEPAELVLHAFGRDAAHVELEGAAEDVATYEKSHRGL